MKRKTTKPRPKPKAKRTKKPRVKRSKTGGVLPLIPLIAAILGGASALASGGASIATAVNKAKQDAKLLAEARRHNLKMEGKGFKKGQLVGKGRPRRKGGKGLYLKPQKI
jgi:hypothetical protein